MTPRGEAVIAEAVANGAWEKLDEVENLAEPEQLRVGLDALPLARANWNAFPRGAKRAILEWISLAKRDETRDARIAETIAKASVGERANQWVRKS
jgi:uncharacterized protein YdeI (YjbR/CyaY-like superfamily)